MIEIALIPIIGILGVLAGGAIGLKLPARILLSIIFSYTLLGVSWWALGYAVFLYAGMAPGHGAPVGAIIDNRKMHDSEWWMPEGIKPYPALALRGLLHLNPAFIISLPLGMWLAVRTPLIKHMSAWRWWEVYKYVIAYGMCLAV